MERNFPSPAAKETGYRLVAGCLFQRIEVAAEKPEKHTKSQKRGYALPAFKINNLNRLRNELLPLPRVAPRSAGALKFPLFQR
jgi:hypothetical protein